MCVNRLFILLVRLLFNSTLLAVKFLGNQKLYTNFQLCGWRGLAPLTSALVKSLVYFILGSRAGNSKNKKAIMSCQIIWQLQNNFSSLKEIQMT